MYEFAYVEAVQVSATCESPATADVKVNAAGGVGLGVAAVVRPLGVFLSSRLYLPRFFGLHADKANDEMIAMAETLPVRKVLNKRATDSP